jgi:hypothetical protein
MAHRREPLFSYICRAISPLAHDSVSFIFPPHPPLSFLSLAIFDAQLFDSVICIILNLFTIIHNVFIVGFLVVFKTPFVCLMHAQSSASLERAAVGYRPFTTSYALVSLLAPIFTCWTLDIVAQ